MEYALGLEPTRPDGGPWRILQTVEVGRGTGITVEFDRMAAAKDIAFSWQLSPNLADPAAWSDSQPFDISIAPVPGGEASVERVTLSVGTEGRPSAAFARMAVRLLVP